MSDLELNPDGVILSGVGTWGVWVNNHSVVDRPAASPSRLNAEEILYSGNDTANGRLIACRLDGSGKRDVDNFGATRHCANGKNDWAAFLASGPMTGVRTSWGLRLPEAMLYLMTPDTLLVKPKYQGAGGLAAYHIGEMDPAKCLWKDDSANVRQYDIFALDGNRIIWTDPSATLRTRGLPTTKQMGPAYDPFVIESPSGYWIGYHGGPFVIHPIDDASQGFIIDMGGGFYTTGMHLSNFDISLAWARGPAGNGDVNRLTMNLNSPRVPLTSPSVPEPPKPEPPKPEPPKPPQQPTEISMKAVELDLHQCELINTAPEVVDFKITKRIEKIDWKAGTSGEGLHFDSQPPMDWVEAPLNDGSGGSLKFTIGICLFIDGKWYASTIIQTYGDIRFGAEPSRFASAWVYDGRWGVMAHYQPKPGETVGFFIVAGNCRDKALQQVVKERSNVVLVPFPDNGGGIINLSYDVVPPEPKPEPEPEPKPEPEPLPTPSTDELKAILLAAVSEIRNSNAELAQRIEELKTQVAAVKAPDYTGELRFLGAKGTVNLKAIK